MYKAVLRTEASSSSHHAASSSHEDGGSGVKFRDVEELSDWMRETQASAPDGPGGRKRKKYYSDDVVTFLDECEPALSDLYADIKDAYHGHGFLSRDDFPGFVKTVFLDNMRISCATESSESDVDDSSATKKNAATAPLTLSS
jgi:hypothetical protein